MDEYSKTNFYGSLFTNTDRVFVKESIRENPARVLGLTNA